MSKKVDFEIFDQKIAPFGKNRQDIIRDMIKSKKKCTGGQATSDRRGNRHNQDGGEEYGI